MNVRKAAGTTVSLIVMIVGFYYLLPVILNSLPYEILQILNIRFYQQSFVSGYHTFILITAMRIIIVAGIIDSILNCRFALGLFKSLNVLLGLSIQVIVLAFIPFINDHMFWGLLYFVTIFGVYKTFRKIIRNNHPTGQKLVKFIKEIKTGGGKPSQHIVDHFIVFVLSLLLVTVQLILMFSMLFYLIANWQMILNS